MTVIALGCMHACGAESLKGDRSNKILVVPCAGRLDLATTLMPFAAGQDGVVVLSCDSKECRHLRCDERGEPCGASGALQVSLAREVLAHTGLSPKRAAHRIIGRGEEPATLFEAYRDEVEKLGGWVRTELPKSSETIEPFVADRCARLFARLQAIRGWADSGGGPQVTGDSGDLLWLGCHDLRAMAVGDERKQDATLELWRRAGRATGSVAAWRCCGQPLLAAGEPEAFTVLAEANASLIAASGAKRVVTSCPHCFESFSEAYRDAGVDLGVAVVDLWDWVEEAFHLRREGEPLALVVPSPHAANQSKTASALTAVAPFVHTMEWSDSGEASSQLRGSELTSSLMKMMSKAKGTGAEAIVATCPHSARKWRAVTSSGGWQVGKALPILDVPQALLTLIES